jgi:O-antigen ligase
VLAAGETQVTLLELVAAVTTAALLWAGRSRLRALATRPPLPLACLAAYACAHVLSAAFAPVHAGLAAKFSLRMVAAALFAFAVATTPRRARRWALAALAASCALVAVLAAGEGLGLTGLDGFLQLFRERPFAVGAARRASGGAAGPNQAAAFLAAGLVAGVGVLAPRWRLVLPFTGALSLGLLFTFSRSGLAAAMLGLLALAWTRRGSMGRMILGSPALLAVLAAGFLVHPSFRARVATDVVAQGYGARYAPADAALYLRPGEKRPLAIELVNTGLREWTPTERPALYVFLHEWPRRRPAGVWRLPLAGPVRPGEAVRATVTIESPAREGTYLLVWDMFTLPSGFLSASGVPPALVPVGVAAPPPDPVALPDRTWRRGRLELWRLALLMWRDHPVSGVGADNFRRLHPEYGGWLTPANYPMTAHNQFLESAATTGTLGLIALLGTLAFTARAAWRGRHGACGLAEVLIALLAAFTTQALVDSLLEFTGVYLLFAFVVGAAAAVQSSAGARSATPARPPLSAAAICTSSDGSGNGSAASARPSRVATSTPGSGGSTV